MGVIHEHLVYQRIRSDEGLTLETSAFQSLYGGQFTLSTPKPNFRVSCGKLVEGDIANYQAYRVVANAV